MLCRVMALGPVAIPFTQRDISERAILASQGKKTTASVKNHADDVSSYA